MFHSRLGDTLRLGGFLVNPEEIETFLQTWPGVEAAQVVGVEQAGTLRPVAFLRLAPGASLDEAGFYGSARSGSRATRCPCARSHSRPSR